ncbi:CUE domain-containing protein C354.10 [Aspergillus udagawae]|uniref:RNA polymerase II degradation factor 1 n=1 Tax=Aspergillus udagawae TaxID=91492 RepID=A0ABQ1B9Y4_9EURO|nr:CUE domain-containing protein C354.10 [Aspergillus udagawae]GFG16916.1 CUE domain-containing protein C354.10 [Aspergillus udagawae]GFG25442.1 CUE domain-containing protein C354.10 [Aspergillus udagawae]
MSEVQTRPSASRGRVSARGGRGGYSSRGGRGGSRSAKADTSDQTTFEDEGEIGQMKKKYSNDLPTLKELFPDWTDEDLVFALEDADGVLEDAIERITEGNVSQWGEVKKKTTDRNRSKAKDAQSTPTEATTSSVRSGRGRGGFEGRGRARGDRGRGGRGGRAGAVSASGARAEKPVVTATVDVVETTIVPEKSIEVETTTVDADTTADTVKEAPKANVMPDGTKKGWASLFAKPAPPPQKKPAVTPTPAPAPVPAPAPAEEQQPAAEPVAEQKASESAPAPAPAPAPAAATAPAPVSVPLPVPIPVEKGPEPVLPKQPAEALPVTPSTAHITPPKDGLTKTNLEQIPDVSPPAPTATAASTVGSTLDANSIAAVSTPARQAAQAAFPSSVFKSGARAPGSQRRVMEQQEAVVMPGNHAVDRAAVQFGSMGLNGDAADVDIDENRENAETRAQPPQHSPVAPRASLPPSTQVQPSTETPTVSRPAPGLPPVPQVSAADSSFTDFARYTEAQKPYDPFSQQVTQPQPQVQEPFANQAPVQPTVTSGSEYSPFYAVDQRLPYNYYGTYGQSQDASVAQRAAAGFGVSGAEVQPQAPTSQPPSRYGHVDAPSSGHNTPNPTLPAATQTPTAQHMPGQAAAHAYGYGYPYYSNPHYASYMSQMTQHQYGRNRPMYDDARRYDDQQQQHYMPHSTQYGYGNQYGPYGKAGMYGQPQGFSYDHSSPATAGSFSQSAPGRDSVYGRTGSTQPSETQQTAAGTNAFGAGMSDVFGRTQAGFGQNQPISQQPPVTSEETKSFETPKAAGPSPSLAQANRPGSATNSVPGQPQAQTGLPPLQGQQGQQGFGGYPHLNPQYGSGLGGLGGHQAGATGQTHHQATGYGNYGGAGFANYYGNTGRGGWGGNYGH